MVKNCGFVPLLPDRRSLRREARHHRGEDQDRHAVADAALGDELAQPHDHGGAGGPDEHDQRRLAGVEARDHVLALEAGEAEDPALALVQCEDEAGGLDDGEADGHVARPLRDLLLTDLAFLLPLLELRDHDLQQLHDDRRRDVRHDPEEEDRDVGDRAAGEQVEEADHAAVVGLVLQLLDLTEVDVRHR